MNINIIAALIISGININKDVSGYRSKFYSFRFQLPFAMNLSPLHSLPEAEAMVEGPVVGRAVVEREREVPGCLHTPEEVEPEEEYGGSAGFLNPGKLLVGYGRPPLLLLALRVSLEAVGFRVSCRFRLFIQVAVRCTRASEGWMFTLTYIISYINTKKK